MRTNSLQDAELLIQKIPCDIGIHRNPRKGTYNAPDKILKDFKVDEKVLVEEVFTDEFSLENTQRRIEYNLKDLIETDKPIISIGGDHSISFPLISALKRKKPEMKVVWLDSHLDLKEKVDNHVSHDVVARELLKKGFSEDDIWFVGITRRDKDEKEFIDRRNLQIFDYNEIEEFKEKIEAEDSPLYLSLDIDVIDPEFAPGTGYPDGKLKPQTVENLIEYLNPSHGDIVEVAPPFDEENKTVELARKFLRIMIRNLE